MEVEGQSITSRNHLKYLGVWLSKGMSMTHHIEEAASKGIKGAMALSKLMPPHTGPCHKARKTIATAALAAVTYGAPVWAHFLQFKKYRELLRKRTKSLCIRVSQCNMRTSAVAAEVLSGIIPVHLQALELCRRKQGEPKKTAREATLDQWQEEWSNAEGVAAWTKRLITDVRKWYNRNHGWTTYHLSQLLSGHGSPREGLFKCGFVKSPSCLFCRELDSTEHAFFRCKMFKGEFIQLERQWGTLTPDNIVSKMMENVQVWEAVDEYAKAVVVRKELWSRVVD